MRGNANVPLEAANGRMNKLYCGMILKTKTPTCEVASWLQANCTGQWDLHPTGIARDGEDQEVSWFFSTTKARPDSISRDRFGARSASPPRTTLPSPSFLSLVSRPPYRHAGLAARLRFRYSAFPASFCVTTCSSPLTTARLTLPMEKFALVVPVSPAGMPVRISIPWSIVSTAKIRKWPSAAAATTSARSIRCLTLAAGNYHPLLAGQASGLTDIEKTLDLLVDPTDRLNPAMLVDRSGHGKSLADRNHRPERTAGRKVPRTRRCRHRLPE